MKHTDLFSHNVSSTLSTMRSLARHRPRRTSAPPRRPPPLSPGTRLLRRPTSVSFHFFVSMHPGGGDGIREAAPFLLLAFDNINACSTLTSVAYLSPATPAPEPTPERKFFPPGCPHLDLCILYLGRAKTKPTCLPLFECRYRNTATDAKTDPPVTATTTAATDAATDPPAAATTAAATDAATDPPEVAVTAAPSAAPDKPWGSAEADGMFAKSSKVR